MIKLSTLALAAALTTAAFSAQAVTVYSSSYGNIAPPGVVFGSGNVNGNFTIGKGNSTGIELGLRAKNYGGATIDGSSGMYSTTVGIVPGRDPLKPRALWNYEFTINSGATALSNYTFQLGVDHDATAGTNFSYVDALTYFGDNANGGLAGFVSQNSENVIFGNTPGGAISPFAAGLYDFTLSAYDLSGALVDQTAMRVDVVGPASVPEPASLALLGLGLAGVVAARRRKQVK